MELRKFLHLLGVDRRHLHQQDVDRPGLHPLGVGYAGRRVVDVDRPDRHVLDAGHPDRRVLDVDRPGPDRLDVGRAGRHVVDVDRSDPDRLRRAYPAARRMGCCLGVGHPDEERPDVVHGCHRGYLHGFVRDARRNHPNAYPAGMRMGCYPGVVPLALVPTWQLALERHLEQVHPELP